MASQHEQRKFPRLSTTEGGYAVSFREGGVDIERSRLVNLSAGGVGVEIQIVDAQHVELGDIMDCLYVDHPDLPYVPLTGVVVRMLGKVPGKTSGYILMGIEFLGITPFVQTLIAEHVDARLNQE